MAPWVAASNHMNRLPAQQKWGLLLMHTPVAPTRALVFLALTVAGASHPQAVAGQVHPTPSYLRDRGSGIPTSLFGTFVGRGQFLVFPFYAYIRDHNREYQPAKLGFGLDQDFRGSFRSTAEVLFLGYGVTDWLTLELEAARISASLDKSPADPSAMPSRIHESGIGDFEAHVRLRFLSEGPRRPGFFGFLEMTPATHRRKALIAEPNWDVKPGLGLVRGFGWGTLQFRIAAEWNREAKGPDLGEVTIEYLKRLSPSFRLNLALEGGESGTNDEWTVVLGGYYRLTNALSLKLDSALGIMSKATDLEAQFGLMLWVRQ